jgi:hypothetical protein
VLDEPEAALSVTGNLALLRRITELVADGSQFVVATHSPILMGVPDAAIYQLGADGFERVAYEETEHYVARGVLRRAPQSGGTFWFRRRTLFGSCRRFSFWRRSNVSSPKAARTRSIGSSACM